MKWYHYLAAFFAGAFLANFVPHFIHGISGDTFPSPFSDPPGKGPSSPMVNVLWGLINLLIGYFLFRASKPEPSKKWMMIVFFLGIAVMSMMLANTFTQKLTPP